MLNSLFFHIFRLVYLSQFAIIWRRLQSFHLPLGRPTKLKPFLASTTTQAFSTPSCNYINAEIFIATSTGKGRGRVRVTGTHTHSNQHTWACTMRAYN